MMLDLSGSKFGRLTVKCRVEDRIIGGRNRTTWECMCECGKLKYVTRDFLVGNRTRSCGCLGIESRITHGLWHDVRFKTWEGMISRCNRLKDHSFKHYGGRGITVCKEWSENPSAFFAWLSENGWRRGLQIDRIDNNRGYYPDNCRIVGPKEQANNRRTNRFVILYGKRLTITEASEIVGVKTTTIRERIKRGWAGDSVFQKAHSYIRKNAHA